MKYENLRYFRRKIESCDLNSERFSMDSTAMPSVNSDYTLYIPSKELSSFSSISTQHSYLTEPQIHNQSFCSEQLPSRYPFSSLVPEKKECIDILKYNADKPPRPKSHRSKDSSKLNVWKKNTPKTSEISTCFIDNYRRLYSNSHSGEKIGASEILPLKLNISGVSSHKWKSLVSQRRVQSAHIEENQQNKPSRRNLEDDSSIQTLLSQLDSAERIIRQDNKPLPKIQALKTKIKQSVSRSHINESRTVRCCGRVFCHSSSPIKVSIIQKAQIPSSRIEINEHRSKYNL